jgi:hypothetical protein
MLYVSPKRGLIMDQKHSILEDPVFITTRVGSSYPRVLLDFHVKFRYFIIYKHIF